MRKLLAGIFVAFAFPIFSKAQTCVTCIQNSAAIQNAQFNITSATIRGQLIVGTLNLSTVTASTVTAGVFIGSGTLLTNLNASQLLFGTVPSAAVTGSYAGITGVGTIASGVWHGTPVGTQWGGLGGNFLAISTGSIFYFSGNGQIGTLLPGDPEAILQTNGYAAPVWTSSPSVSGVNIYGLKLSSLSSGTLPTNIIVTTNSIPYVNGSSVLGNISGSAGSYTGTILLSQLSTGTLPNSVVASSITGTGIYSGTYGDSSHTLQIKYGTDGRASTITVLSLSVPLSGLQSGTLPGGVTVPAASINAGSLGGSVVASSVANSGVSAGTYGGPGAATQFSVGNDGRITSAAQYAIPGFSTTTAFVDVDNAWHHAQTSISSWTINANLQGQTITATTGFSGSGTSITGLVPANIVAGTLPSNVVASSLAVQSVGTTQINSASTISVTGYMQANTYIVSAGTQPSMSIIPSTGITVANVITSTGGVWFYGQGNNGGLARFIHTNTDTLGNSIEMNINPNAVSGQFGAFFFSTGTPNVNVAGQRAGLLWTYPSGALTMSRFGGGSGGLTFGSEGTASLTSNGGGNLNIVALGSGTAIFQTNGAGNISVGAVGSGNATLFANGAGTATVRASGSGAVQINSQHGEVDIGSNFEGSLYAVSQGTGNAFYGSTGSAGDVTITANGGSIYKISAVSQTMLAGGDISISPNGNIIINPLGVVTVTSQINSNANIIVSAPGHITVSGSSVTASAFFGDGSHLTGVSATVSVNASLTGDGSGGSPLGVKSSSVAVLNASGFVQNFQLDSSSVTKQGFVSLANLSGAVPSGRVDFSTITTALATKASTGTDNSMTRANALTTFGTVTTFLSSASFTAAGATQFSLQTSSGIKMLGGIIQLPDGTVIYSTAQFSSGSGISGSGTSGFVPVFTGATSVGNSNLQQSGTDAAFNSAPGSGGNTLMSGDGSNTASGANATCLGGGANVCSGGNDGVLGGSGNTLDTGSNSSMIGAGSNNYINDVENFVGGGSGHILTGQDSAIVGGVVGTIDAVQSIILAGGVQIVHGINSGILAGHTNTVNGDYGIIAGGLSNTVSGNKSGIFSSESSLTNSTNSVVVGGSSNQATGDGAGIFSSSASIASGSQSMVLGGKSNVASGILSVAMGNNSRAQAKGSFVISDSVGNSVIENTTDQMLLKFSSGVALYGVYLSSTTQGTVSCNAGTPVLSVTATDQHGNYAAGAGATSCTYTFSNAWPKTPDCVCGTNLVASWASTVTTTAVTCSGSVLTGATVTFICNGAP